MRKSVHNEIPKNACGRGKKKKYIISHGLIALALFALAEKSLTRSNIDKILTELLDWHNLGTKLGLPDHKLKEIQFDCTGAVRQRQEMICKWLEYDTEASWNKLARALKEMGMRVVAKEILDKYVPGYWGRFA